MSDELLIALNTGTRIRHRREALGIKQADLAKSVDISASYLNLIEHNHRNIGGKLLTRIAAALTVEPQILSTGRQAGLADRLSLAARGVKAETEAMRIDDLILRYPGWAAAIAEQADSIAHLERVIAGLNERLSHDPVVAKNMQEILAAVSAIRSTASILIANPEIDAEWRTRFHGNIDSESRRLAETSAAMLAQFETLARADPEQPSSLRTMLGIMRKAGYHFEPIEHLGAQGIATTLSELDDDAPQNDLSLTRDMLARYASDAQILPLAEFRQAARDAGFDPARLATRFQTDLPTVFRRLASLPRSPEHPEIGLLACDASGVLTFCKSPHGFEMPPSAETCPNWPLFEALRQPLQPVRRAVRTPQAKTFYAFAVAYPAQEPDFEAPTTFTAWMLLISADHAQDTVAVGPGCLLCSQKGCGARREPSILTPDTE